MTVPIIDIGASFDGGESAARNIAQTIGNACEDIGFFAIEGHGLDQSLLDIAFSTAADFYAQPQATKDRFRPAQSSAARGYHKLGTKNLAKTLGYNNPPDLREQFYIGPIENWAPRFEAYPEAAFLYAPNIWPESPISYRAAFGDLYLTFEKLAVHLMRLFARALDMQAVYFDNRIDRHFSTLPVNNYPALEYEPEPNQVRCGEHSDFGSLTILAIGEGEAGLEVLTRKGDWTDVKTQRGQLVVNIGDMMQRWTNDRWISNVHRVVNPPGASSKSRRQSLGFFLHPNFDAEIACLSSCTDQGNPVRYPAVQAGPLMVEKLRARAA
ncbi:MAG: isopenicillin N synthase family oxygenase [Chromatiales bacterium]|jgi:isopenicillin N synthase-like dioxygenase|nr:isopenicillin N synthase family oxygenase [Chromatiales bacterium]